MHFGLATATIAAKIFREESSLSRCAVKYIYLRRGYLVCRAAGQCRPRPRPPGHGPRRGRAVCRALGGRPRRGGEERGAAQLTGMVRHYAVDIYLHQSIYIYPPVTLADTVHCFPFQKRKCGAGVARLTGVRNPTRLPRLIPSKEVGEGDTEPLEEPPLLEELGEDGFLEPDIKH